MPSGKTILLPVSAIIKLISASLAQSIPSSSSSVNDTSINRASSIICNAGISIFFMIASISAIFLGLALTRRLFPDFSTVICVVTFCNNFATSSGLAYCNEITCGVIPTSIEILECAATKIDEPTIS